LLQNFYVTWLLPSLLWRSSLRVTRDAASWVEVLNVCTKENIPVSFFCDFFFF
jgi:hypothetical protein